MIMDLQGQQYKVNHGTATEYDRGGHHSGVAVGAVAPFKGSDQVDIRHPICNKIGRERGWTLIEEQWYQSGEQTPVQGGDGTKTAKGSRGITEVEGIIGAIGITKGEEQEQPHDAKKHLSFKERWY